MVKVQKKYRIKRFIITFVLKLRINGQYLTHQDSD